MSVQCCCTKQEVFLVARLWLNSQVQDRARFGDRIGGIGVQKLGQKRYSIDLNAHMAECEANYGRLMRLMPMLAEGDRSVFAMMLGESEPRVILRVVARYKYTTVIELSQENAREQAADVPETRIGIRLYHDARAAEVIAFQDQRGFRAVYGYPNRQMRHPDEKVQINRFLGEFLRMCIAHGISLEQPAPADRFDGMRATLQA